MNLYHEYSTYLISAFINTPLEFIMDYIFGILSSDEINRYGYKITIKALENMLDQNFEEGIPSAIQHDIHRPAGWTMPFGLYMEAGLTMLAGISLLPSSDEDNEYIHAAFNRGIYLRNEEECSKYKKDLENLLNNYLSKDYECLSNICTSIVDIGLAKSVFPDIFQHEDKDKLIPLEVLLKKFEPLTGGLFKAKKSDLILFIHPYFRRSLSRFNNFNSNFLDQFLRLKEINEEVNLKIALDEDMVGYAPSFAPPIELAYWYGPKFNNDIVNIPKDITVHLSMDRDKFFYGLNRTEFRWKPYKNLRIFEAEELKDIKYPSLGISEDKFGCRYVHSQFDITNKTFNHFDGALKIYTLEKMRRRLNKNLNKSGKKSEYTKIFRIDGKLDIDEWKSLVSNYFKENSLVIEYFNGKILEKETNVEKDDIRQKINPYFLNELKGIKIAISYHKLDKNYSNEKRAISVLDILTIDDEKYEVVESDVFELKKALQRLGDDLEIPDSLKFIKFTDLYLNFPLITHGRINLPENLNKTIEAFKLITENIKLDKIISITLSWPTDKKELRLSILGHVKDISDFLNKFGIDMPILDNKIHSWLEQISEWITTKYPNSQFIEPLNEIFKFSGILLIKRLQLSPQILNDSYYSYEFGEYPKLNFEKLNENLIDDIKSQRIQTATSFILNKSTCSVCNEDYRTCPHSKYLDEVNPLIEDIEPVSVFLTDKKNN